jgi:hypothetical protein
MRSSVFSELAESFKALPTSEKVRLSEAFVDKSLGIADKLFSSFFSPKIVKNPRIMDRNRVPDGFRRISDSSLPKGIVYLKEDEYLN